jgi:hypothetical protein
MCEVKTVVAEAKAGVAKLAVIHRQAETAGMFQKVALAEQAAAVSLAVLQNVVTALEGLSNDSDE